MKGSNQFKQAIQNYLAERAIEDPLFAVTLQKEGKSIDDCITYILNTVQKSGNNGFDDDEIFGMAVHYYDEDDIKVGEPITGVRIVSNHFAGLTPEEEAKAKEDAKNKIIREEQERLKAKKTKPPVKTEAKPDPDNHPFEQLSLF